MERKKARHWVRNFGVASYMSGAIIAGIVYPLIGPHTWLVGIPIQAVIIFLVSVIGTLIADAVGD